MWRFMLALTCGVTLRAQKPCTTLEYHQFDFFAGDWDAHDVRAPTKIIARDHVTPMVGGCALREVYEQNDGMVGESFSTYDVARKLWHQSWVTNLGKLLLLEGHFENGRMTLTAPDWDAKGKPSLLKGVWSRESDGAVRETAVRSTDGGKTWQPEFDIIFRPHPH
jgi:hypothetical protein